MERFNRSSKNPDRSRKGNDMQGAPPSVQKKDTPTDGFVWKRHGTESFSERRMDIEESSNGFKMTLNALRENTAYLREHPGVQKLPHRVAVFVGPGGSRGAVSVGVGMALQKAGLLEGVSTFVGVSAGAHIAKALAQRVMSTASYVYRNVIANNPSRDPDRDFDDHDRRFIDVNRGLRGLVTSPAEGKDSPFVRMNKITDRVRRESYALPHQKLIVAATEAHTAKPRFFELDASEKGAYSQRTLDAVDASSALPAPMSEGDRHIDGERGAFTDGAFTAPMPAEYVCDEYLSEDERPTHVIVIANRPREMPKLTAIGWLGEKILTHHFKPHIRDAHKSGDPMFMENIKWLRKSGIPYTIIWNDDADPGLLDDDPQLISASITRAYTMTNLRMGELVDSVEVQPAQREQRAA